MGVTKFQRELVEDNTSSEVIFQGGVGSGKTWSGALKAIQKAQSTPTGVDGMIVSCTFKQQVKAVFPTLANVMEKLHVDYSYNAQDQALLIGPRKQRVWMCSAEDPDSLAGPTIGWAWLDEAGLMQAPAGKRSAYERVSQRLRDRRLKTPRQMWMTSTPEGTRTWMNERVKVCASWDVSAQGKCPIHFINAPTRSNVWNPADFNERLAEMYKNDPDGWRNYVEGIATDSTGTIYTQLRAEHFVEANPIDARRLQLVVGWDFNIGTMATVLCTWNESARILHVFGEVVSHDITTDVHAERVVEALKKSSGVVIVSNTEGQRRLVDGRQRNVHAYIDASGAARTTNASTTDQRLVSRAGFAIRSLESNPPVRDRIASMQFGLRNNHIRIDAKRAPHFARAIKEHTYDKHGDPQKSFAKRADELDHFNDALGYAVHGLLPAGSARSLSAELVPRMPNTARDILSQMMSR
jgi:PBSX family phage terminase large subunit